MFIDWLDMYQDHPEAMEPREGAYIEIDAISGEYRRMRQPRFNHEGSYSTSIRLTVAGGRVSVSGNPSKLNRLDNLFGYSSLDAAVGVFNQVLLTLGYPPFTKCTTVQHKQSPDGKRAIRYGDGATFQRIDITENRAVGQGCERDYLKALSTQKYRNSVPQLYTNGNTVDWKSVKGNARMIYPCVYIKAHEIGLHQLPSIKRTFGIDSDEYRYVSDLQKYCETSGIVRFEQKLKADFLRENNLAFWGLFSTDDLHAIHEPFLNIDDKLQVTAMSLESIAERLLRLGIVDNTRASMTTAMYAIQWANGHTFDFSLTQVRTHRARLRKIGIDLAMPCDISRHSPVYIRKAQEITIASPLVPSWYRAPPSHLRSVA